MSRSKATPPTVTQDDGPLGGTIKKHPAFGMLRFSRCSGDPGKLFGSEINHASYITMTLVEGDEHRSLSHTFYHGHGRSLCEVNLSAAQFAELITSMNMGSGVPVTIRHVMGDSEPRPHIEDTDTLHEQIKTDIKDKTKRVTNNAKSLEKELATMLADCKIPKVKQEALKSLVGRIVQDLESNLPYVLDQYQEAAEKVGAKAKAELEAYASMVITQLGMQALAEGKKPLELRDSE